MCLWSRRFKVRVLARSLLSLLFSSSSFHDLIASNKINTNHFHAKMGIIIFYHKCVNGNTHIKVAYWVNVICLAFLLLCYYFSTQAM